MITLNNFDDADYLLNNAKSLRKATDKYVQGNIYINKHFTSAEAKANFEARNLRRNKSSAKPQSVGDGDGHVGKDEQVTNNVTVHMDIQQASA